MVDPILCCGVTFAETVASHGMIVRREYPGQTMFRDAASTASSRFEVD